MPSDSLDELLAAIEVTSPTSPPRRKLLTRKMSEVEQEYIDWIIPNFLPRGMLTTFSAIGGTGKSTVTTNIASICSVGGMLPNGWGRAPLLNTLLFSGEESAGITIKSRLLAEGANLDRIHIVDGVGVGPDDPDGVALPRDLAYIEEKILDEEIGLLVFDPIADYMPGLNQDVEADVRSVLSPLKRVAERTGCAIICIKHNNKSKAGGLTNRVANSIAFVNVPRMVWSMAELPAEYQSDMPAEGEEPGETACALGVIKTNLGPRQRAHQVTITKDGLRWDGPSPMSLDEVDRAESAQPTRPSRASMADEGRLPEAMAFLGRYLAGGMKPSNDIYARAQEQGISGATLRRAKDELSVDAKKMRDGWYWSLPIPLSDPAKQDAQLSLGDEHLERLERLEHLNPDGSQPIPPVNQADPALPGLSNDGLGERNIKTNVLEPSPLQPFATHRPLAVSL